ncbi:hypothetical protein C8R47DRAFT_1231005 [Mycena vitilis]|nr:hypothetical protein C8R47DRAFT_1231005 [Mycena vitilis]
MSASSYAQKSPLPGHELCRIRMVPHDKFQGLERHEDDSRNRYYLVKTRDSSWALYTQYQMGHRAGRRGDVRTYGARFFLDMYLKNACKNKIPPCSFTASSSTSTLPASTFSGTVPNTIVASSGLAASSSTSTLAYSTFSGTVPNTIVASSGLAASSGLSSAAVVTGVSSVPNTDEDAPPHYEKEENWRQSWWWFYLVDPKIGFLTRDKNVAESQVTKRGNSGVGFRATFKLAVDQMRKLLDLDPDQHMYYVLENGHLSVQRDPVHTEYAKHERKGSVLCCAADMNAASTYIREELVYMGLV